LVSRAAKSRRLLSRSCGKKSNGFIGNQLIHLTSVT
jgi:hypothetical protein